MTEATHFHTSGNRFLLVVMVSFVFLILSGIPFTFFTSISGTLTGNSIFSSVESTGSGVVQWIQQSSGSLLPYLLGTVSFLLILLFAFFLRHLLKKKLAGLPPEQPVSFPSRLPAEKSAQPIHYAPLPKAPAKAAAGPKFPLRRWQGKATMPLDEELASINQKLAALGGEPARMPVLMKPSEPAKKIVSLPRLPRPIPERSAPVWEEPRAKKRPITPGLSLQPLTDELAYIEEEFKILEKAVIEKPKLRTVVPPTEGHALPLTGTEKKIMQQTPRRYGSFFQIPEKLLAPLFRQQERTPVQRTAAEKALPPLALSVKKEVGKAEQGKKTEKESKDVRKTTSQAFQKSEKRKQPATKQQAISDADAVAEEIRSLLRKDFA